MSQHPFGMIAGLYPFHYRRAAGRVQSGQQNGGFHLSRRHRGFIVNRQRIRGSSDGQRQQGSFPPREFSAKQAERCRNAFHRTAPQARIPGKDHRNRMRGCNTHQQTHTGSGITHVDDVRRLAQGTDPPAMHMPDPVRVTADLCTEGPHGISRGQNILAFQQAGNRRLPDGEAAEHQTAM